MLPVLQSLIIFCETCAGRSTDLDLVLLLAQHSLDFTQKNVCGEVRLRLYRGNVMNIGRSSPRSLYKQVSPHMTLLLLLLPLLLPLLLLTLLLFSLICVSPSLPSP